MKEGFVNFKSFRTGLIPFSIFTSKQSMQLLGNTFHSKLPNVKTTIFTTMNKLAAENNAINLSQGFPDFDSPPELITATSKAMLTGANQYAPMAGSKVLREAISLKTEKLYDVSYHPETEITITAGATQALFTAISAFIHPGDEVLVIKPAFDCYEPAIEMNGGIPVFYQLEAPHYKIDWKLFAEKISPQTKMIVLNTPHNPTGTVLGKKDLKALENILKNTSIILLCDDVYEHILFEGETHQSACLFPELKKRALICSSFGKTFHITGWKIGYCMGPKELMEEFRKVHQFNVFCVSHPFQVGLAAYLSNENHYLELPSFYQEKRDFFIDAIQGSKFNVIPSKGTYFQLLDYSDITNENDVEYATRLVKEHKIASIPISPFNTNGLDPKVLRFCFAKKNETLEKAAEILCKIN